jgi:hypothetical protein
MRNPRAGAEGVVRGKYQAKPTPLSVTQVIIEQAQVSRHDAAFADQDNWWHG